MYNIKGSHLGAFFVCSLFLCQRILLFIALSVNQLKAKTHGNPYTNTYSQIAKGNTNAYANGNSGADS